ncbi:MAG: fluoride efflux transporter CrcB [Planctomycetota bacterium]|nr:fluoride efflux transporter CrcB [Planctomycetota bacterium]
MPAFWQTVLPVALGGSLGALARLAVYHLAAGPTRTHGPWPTMLINLIGCLALGLFLGWATRRPDLDERMKAFLTVGVLGAFTTFSTYAADALKLIHEQRWGIALIYITASSALGLALCAGGYALAR